MPMSSHVACTSRRSAAARPSIKRRVADRAAAIEHARERCEAPRAGRCKRVRKGLPCRVLQSRGAPGALGCGRGRVWAMRTLGRRLDRAPMRASSARGSHRGAPCAMRGRDPARCRTIRQPQAAVPVGWRVRRRDPIRLCYCRRCRCLNRACRHRGSHAARAARRPSPVASIAHTAWPTTRTAAVSARATRRRARDRSRARGSEAHVAGAASDAGS